jgi:5-(carboxyamino)imidazole ribonucleotide synthase
VDVVMENLIGDDVARVPDLARQPDVQLHLYGKRAARPGRKMGHANRIIRA